jgi:hypothetical protein
MIRPPSPAVNRTDWLSFAGSATRSARIFNTSLLFRPNAESPPAFEAVA